MGVPRLVVALLLAAAGLVAGHAPARAALPAGANARKQLVSELARISQASGGTLGVSALHLETGERVQLRASERFPMASTYKVALAIKVLDAVDHDALSLEQAIEIDPGNLSPGSGELKETRPDAQRTATVGELLGAMLRESDNTASDILMERIGGPAAVALHLRRLGVDEIDVSRPAAQLVADAWGFKLPAAGERTSKAIGRLQHAVSPAARIAAAQRFLEDPRDTATPDAMVALLELLQRGKAVSAAGTAVMLGHMRQCRTGPGRLKGGLPRATVVAHKTGTLTRVATNDVGIVELPGGGHLVVAIYLRGSARPVAEQERAIAAASRALHRHYMRRRAGNQ